MQSLHKKSVGVLISGRGSNLLSLINASFLADSPFVVACVIASCDAEGLRYAKEFSIPCFVVKENNFANKISFETEMCRILRSFNVEFVCLAGFMKILSPFFVQNWPNKLINIHPSLLPSFKGLNAQEQALKAGVKVTGCTVHFVDEGVDTGKIILQRTVPVMDNDTVGLLSDRILAIEHECYPDALRLLM